MKTRPSPRPPTPSPVPVDCRRSRISVNDALRRAWSGLRRDFEQTSEEIKKPLQREELLPRQPLLQRIKDEIVKAPRSRRGAGAKKDDFRQHRKEGAPGRPPPEIFAAVFVATKRAKNKELYDEQFKAAPRKPATKSSR